VGLVVGGNGARKRFETPMCKRIGIPRAAVTADEIGEVADFFSFGTNDLTQLAFGCSRDDIGSVLPAYLEKGMRAKVPLQSFETIGVGGPVKVACEKDSGIAEPRGRPSCSASAANAAATPHRSRSSRSAGWTM
jgi:hypothetical protein